jgi:hypothetical protein
MLVMMLPSHASDGAAELVMAIAHQGTTADKQGAITGHQGATVDCQGATADCKMSSLAIRVPPSTIRVSPPAVRVLLNSNAHAIGFCHEMC